MRPRFLTILKRTYYRLKELPLKLKRGKDFIMPIISGRHNDINRQINTCPICNLMDFSINKFVHIADGNIFFCSNCKGYYLSPSKQVLYDNSGWTSKRESQFQADQLRGEQYAHAIQKWFTEHSERELSSVLEIGCGTAFMSPGFTKLGIKYTGIDIDNKSIEVAREAGFEAELVSAEGILDSDISKRHYDLIISSNAFEHFNNPRKAFQNIKLLNFNLAIIIVPNPEGLLPTIKANKIIRRLINHHNGTNVDVVYTIDGHWHNIAYSQFTLKYLCNQYGLKIELVKSIGINDSVFGFVQPNTGLLYRLLSFLCSTINRDSQLIAIIKGNND